MTVVWGSQSFGVSKLSFSFSWGTRRLGLIIAVNLNSCSAVISNTLKLRFQSGSIWVFVSYTSQMGLTVQRFGGEEGVKDGGCLRSTEYGTTSACHKASFVDEMSSPW